MKTEVPGEN